MPKIQFFGEQVRVRPMLDAIGTQEALEAYGRGVGPLSRRSPAYERERMALARRRNAAERRLRPEEHRAWERWRAADESVRAAGYAVLVDPPPPYSSSTTRGRHRGY